RRGAGRGTRDPPHLARARGDLLALRPHPRPLRRTDRGRARRRGLRGADRVRDARRYAGSSVSEPDPNIPPVSPEQAAATGTLASRISLRQRSGGIIVPVFTVVLAFLIGGAVVAATGHNPFVTYHDIFDGAGLNWFG